ncbi:hypothetical protein NX81_014650 [Xanthomonas vasicola]|nr:hypothetical protein NX81_014650 [Xanthomonas vasicola]
MSSWNLLGKGYEKIPLLASANLRGDYHIFEQKNTPLQCAGLDRSLAAALLEVLEMPVNVAMSHHAAPSQARPAKRRGDRHVCPY